MVHILFSFIFSVQLENCSKFFRLLIIFKFLVDSFFNIYSEHLPKQENIFRFGIVSRSIRNRPFSSWKSDNSMYHSNSNLEILFQMISCVLSNATIETFRNVAVLYVWGLCVILWNLLIVIMWHTECNAWMLINTYIRMDIQFDRRDIFSILCSYGIY